MTRISDQVNKDTGRMLDKDMLVKETCTKEMHEGTRDEGRKEKYRVSHNTVSTLFLVISRLPD